MQSDRERVREEARNIVDFVAQSRTISKMRDGYIDAIACAIEKAEKRVHEQYLDKSDRAVHVIRNGDTLWGLAVRYTGIGNNWYELAWKNRHKIEDENRLVIGSTLVLPGSWKHC